MLYLIGHLNHSEQHLIEADAYLRAPFFTNLADRIREYRKLAGQVMFEIERLSGNGGGSKDFRTSWESIWCTLKHVVTALIHIDETIEKIVKRARSAKPEEAEEMLRHVQRLLEVRRGVMDVLTELIRRAKSAAGDIDIASIRCREDLCLEEEEEAQQVRTTT